MSEEMKTLGGLMLEVYKDTTQPAARSVGRALESVVDLVAYPVARCAEIAQKNMVKFFDKMKAEQQET